MIKKKWTDDLRDRMSRYESTDVPQGLWDGIELALDSKPQSRVIPWIRIVSIAAAAVTALFVMVVPSEEEQSAMIQAAAEKTAMQAPIANNTDNIVEPVEAYVGESGVVMSAVTIKNDVSESGTEAISVPVNEDVLESATEKSSKPVREDVSVPGKDRINDKPAKRNNTESTVDNRLLADYSGKKPIVSRKGREVSLSMYASNITSSSSSMDGYGSFASMHHMAAVRPQGSAASFVNPAYTVAYSNRYASTTTKIDHHQPISIGLGARYFLNSRWAVETGVTYSMLESEIESGTERSYIYNNQKVQYVGVPLTVGYQWINGKRLSVYTGGGVTAEFGVNGKMDKKCVVEGGSIDRKTDDIHDIPMQWSVGVAAGMQYNVIGNLGIYVEPGMVYYIDNGSSLQTSYSDKPLNFKLKLGVRFDLNTKKR